MALTRRPPIGERMAAQYGVQLLGALPLDARIREEADGGKPTVVAAPQTLDAVKDGLADLSFIVHGYTPGRFVATDVAEFPFLADTSEVNSVAYQRVHDKLLAKQDEHKGVHVVLNNL